MKSKKILLPALILAVAVFVIGVLSLVAGIAKKPTVTEAEFPFSITYELDGETVTIHDVYKAYYDRNGGYADTKTRIYLGEIGDMGEGNTVYTLKREGNTRIELWTCFYPDYMMGDSEYEYFDEEPFEPRIYYYDSEENEYHDEKTLSEQGVKLIGFEYPEPIKNTLVFSHISYLSGEIVFPTVFIALLALLAIMIFVKKEKELRYKAVDWISMGLNILLFFTLIPFVTILAVLIDINGGGPEIYRQMFYFVPPFSVFCIAASVALRRKNYGVKALITTLIAPFVFALYLLVFTVLDLL